MHDVIRKGGTVCAHFVAIKEEMVPLKGDQCVDFMA